MFSGMIIKSQTGYFFHAGDSRIYLIREGTLKQLTRDHIASIRNGRSFLAWAMGMDNSIQIDYGKVALQPGDRLLISQALANGSDDNLSCAVVEDRQSGKTLVMKTLSVNFVDDTGYIDRFIQEEWIGKRIESPKVVHIVRQKHPRTFLYYLMEYVEGISMDKWMVKNPAPKPKVAIDIIEQIAEGLNAFHQKETIHQDLKPANILIDDSGEDIKVTIVDFGSVFVAGLAESFIPLEHQGALGTATYSDPQYLSGKNSSIQGDLYSLATICYELFTGHLPYTEKISECIIAFQFDRLRYISAAEHKPVIPVWFDPLLPPESFF
jgi:serine/threonine protein kinase